MRQVAVIGPQDILASRLKRQARYVRGRAGVQISARKDQPRGAIYCSTDGLIDDQKDRDKRLSLQ